mgnify:FL=1
MRAAVLAVAAAVLAILVIAPVSDARTPPGAVLAADRYVSSYQDYDLAQACRLYATTVHAAAGNVGPDGRVVIARCVRALKKTWAPTGRATRLRSVDRGWAIAVTYRVVVDAHAYRVTFWMIEEGRGRWRLVKIT